jgi:transglutaminase-like putative cysteine protease
MSETLFRALRWLISEKIGAATLLSIALAFGALYGVALGIAEGVRGLDQGLAVTVVALALSGGWVLGRSSVRGRTAAAILAVAGLIVIVFRVGRLGGDLLAIFRAAPPLLIAGLNWALSRGQVDLSPYWNVLTEALGILAGNIGVLFSRLNDFIVGAVNNSGFDPVGAALVWSAVLWALAAWAGWRLRRDRQPLQALLPALLTLTILRFNRPALSPFAAVVPLGATLLLTALTSYHVRELRWQRESVDYPEEVGRDVAIIAIPLALLLTLAAASLPLISFRDINDWLVKQLSGPIISFGPTRATPQPVAAPAFNADLSPGLPRSHLLVAGPEELKKDLALIIQVSDLAPAAPPDFHWRSVTYDQYTGRGWRVARNEVKDYAAGELINQTTSQSIRVVRQHVQVVNNQGGMLYVTGALLTVNQPYRAAWRTNDDLFGANVFSTDYEAVSRLPVFSDEGLRAASRLYPDWVTRRYLALPDSVPDRVLALARDLTATERTPYDRARALEGYLRQIPYSLDVPTPPRDQDVVDFFIFDLRRGYCDYYATAMAVMARAAGLPARLVIGYAGGTYDAENNRYFVTEADAHSWAEVYFPEVGWVEFEPTGGRPEIDRFTDSSPIIPQLPPPPAPEPAIKIDLRSWVWPTLFWVVGLAAVTFVAWAAADYWRLARMSPSGVAGELYRRLRRHAKRLGLPTRGGDTLNEFARTFAAQVDASIAQEVKRLVAFYAQASYSPHPPTADDKRRLLQRWPRLDRELWRRWAKHQLYIRPVQAKRR